MTWAPGSLCSRSDSSGSDDSVPGGMSRSLELPHLSVTSKTEWGREQNSHRMGSNPCNLDPRADQESTDWAESCTQQDSSCLRIGLGRGSGRFAPAQSQRRSRIRSHTHHHWPRCDRDEWAIRRRNDGPIPLAQLHFLHYLSHHTSDLLVQRVARAILSCWRHILPFGGSAKHSRFINKARTMISVSLPRPFSKNTPSPAARHPYAARYGRK